MSIDPSRCKMMSELRGATGAPAQTCWIALKQAGWDIGKARAALKSDGLVPTDRSPADERMRGIVAVAVDVNARAGAIVELNVDPATMLSHPEIAEGAHQAALAALRVGPCRDLVLATASQTGEPLATMFGRLSEKLALRVALRRVEVLRVEDGVVAGWVSEPEGSVGALGVLVGLQSTGQPEMLTPIAHRLANHIAIADPQYISIEDIPETVRAAKRWVLTDEIHGEGRAPTRLEQEIDQRLRSYYQTIVLEWQEMVNARCLTVRQMLGHAESEVGASVSVAGFVRYQAGEALDRVISTMTDDIEWSFGNAWATEAPAALYPLGDQIAFECAAHGPSLRNDRDVVDLLSAVWNQGATMVIVPVSRLAEGFFPLETRIAGPILQKFATFGTPVVFMGDISQAVDASPALRAFVRETNRQSGIWFLPNRAVLDERIASLPVAQTSD